MALRVGDSQQYKWQKQLKLAGHKFANLVCRNKNPPTYDMIVP